MNKLSKEEREKRAVNELIRKQARYDPVCSDYISQQAFNYLAGGGFAFIETQLNFEDEEDDFRPY